MAAVQSHFEHDGISCQSGAPQHRGCSMLENSRSRHMCVVSVAVAEDVGEIEMIDAAASAASEADTQQLSQLHRRRS